ncbi:IS1634 family transposase [Fodinicurvata fenggangensis]|uniref:IS1634 family transposase n=1 Tax=Fodinicurvata fenggangensis TaxID=1121830 RepID=UPI00047C0303|nr:IS1634 family transposase [Fodinicurvata fenggangensis]
MFVREKTIRGYSYLYLVESVREGGRSKQRIIKNLGRKESVQANGDLERLLASIERFSERSLVLSQLESGEMAGLSCRRIGPPLLFGRLWEESGCQAVLAALAGQRKFEFSLERAVFTAVLHRIMVSGSDRACETWMADYDIPGAQGLSLHHFYRAMAWLGEELPADRQAQATPFAPRTVKDEVEEALFERRRDLFTDLSVVFLDTTSLAFHGAGGETLGARGHSKDHRPDLNQMIVGAVIDSEGRPVCSEMWPGNTADVTVLLPIVDRLRQRFSIGRVCVVADRGMISAATIAGLEERGLEYVLGVRERSERLVREAVLEDSAPFTPLLIERATGETQLFVKEVLADGRRYIVVRNEAETRKDRADRAAILEALERQLKKGDKALVGNSAYRRYLRKAGEPAGTPGAAFEIDAGKLAEEARYDGIFVLRTNARISPLQAVLRYRDLLQVEELFRNAKALMRTRPIYHSSDAPIRGHVFCSFLALVLRKELQARCAAAGLKPEWGEVLRDLDRLQDIEFAKDGKTMGVRTPATGVAGSLFKAVGVALPPNLRDVA